MATEKLLRAEERLASGIWRAVPLFPKHLLYVDALVRRSGLPLSQLQTLMLLDSSSMTIGDLSRSLCIAKPNVSAIVDELENVELVMRSRNSADRRVVFVRLTEKGMNRCNELKSVIRTEIDKQMQQTSTYDPDRLAEAMETLLDVLPNFFSSNNE